VVTNVPLPEPKFPEGYWALFELKNQWAGKEYNT